MFEENNVMHKQTKNDDKETIKNEIDFWISTISFESFFDEISKSIIGQKNLRLILANVYNYLKNIIDENPVNNNMILAAPSGAGKTETYRALKKYFHNNIPSLPVYIQDMSRVTASGYKGMEPSELLIPFYQKGMTDAIGIVFLDEFDKKVVSSFSSTGQDTNKETQNCLLTLVEGSNVYDRTGFVVNTSNIMFIGLGSFNECRIHKKEKPNGVGFGSSFNENTKTYDEITREDMIQIGGIYELIGRFPVITNYFELKEEEIIKIIDKIRSDIALTFDCNLRISKDMMKFLIEEANGEFGCRMIDSYIRQPVLDAYAEALLNKKENKKLTITVKSKEKASCRWKEPTESEKRNMELLEAFKNALKTPVSLQQLELPE